MTAAIDDTILTLAWKAQSFQSRAPREVIPVRPWASVTEVGTLRLGAMPRTAFEHWKVVLNVRGAACD